MKTEIAQWIEKAKISIEQKTKERWPTCQLNWLTLGYDKGPKFIKLWTNRPGTASKSAYAFIDMEGNIYKAAGWKAPAKGVRGTILTVDPTTLDGSIGWLYK